MRSTTISGRCWRRAASRARTYTRPRRSSSTLAGRNVVVVTPTASEKTLCYNVPVLSAMLDQPATRALYLFPTKALAQDQLAELHELTDGLRTHGHDIGAYTYDGDTPQDAHRAIRGRAHLVLSNPEMLHLGILPHHPRWVKLFENLRYIAIDELHAYRGVFGSHLANILRRLQRICRHYGSAQRFICSSATIANPRELAERLTEEPFSLVNRSGAPRGEKQFVIVNPPVVSPQLGIRSFVSVRSPPAGTRVPATSAADHRVYAEPTGNGDLDDISQGRLSGAAGWGRWDSRLPRRLSAPAPWGDRAGSTRRCREWRRVDQRARARYRHRVLGCVLHGGGRLGLLHRCHRLYQSDDPGQVRCRRCGADIWSGGGCEEPRRGARGDASRRIQEDQILYGRERLGWRPGPSGAADAHERLLVDSAAGAVCEVAPSPRRATGRGGWSRDRVARYGPAAVDVRSSRHRIGDSR